VNNGIGRAGLATPCKGTPVHTIRPALDASFSLYLDFARFSAALCVVVMHIVMAGLVTPETGAFIPVLGREAVIAFFVLSGFVIMYSVDKQRNTFKEYAVARCARIYSVVLPVLLTAFLMGAVVTTYLDTPVGSAYQVLKPQVYIPLHLAFMGEIWNLSETPPWLAPYWSLGYEVWYYVIFGAAYFTSGVKRIALVAGILLMVGFKLWLLFPIWLSGVWLYRWIKSNMIPMAWARAGFMLSIAGLCIYKVANADIFLRAYGISIWPFPGLRLGSADRYLADYVICALVLLNFACAASMRFPNLLRFKKPIRALAGYTFTLYLVHNLVLMLWKAVYPHNAASVTDIALLVLTVGGVTYLTGIVTERRKAAYERFFRALYEKASRMWAAGSSIFQR
jgi:peptidoglycan/LPS O-acetylase OafA/YrhL